jgi:hypothetical protein
VILQAVAYRIATLDKYLGTRLIDASATTAAVLACCAIAPHCRARKFINYIVSIAEYGKGSQTSATKTMIATADGILLGGPRSGDKEGKGGKLHGSFPKC